MMGERRVQQEALFYEFSLERHVPETHLLRHIDRFVELDGLRRELVPFYSEMGRPSIDPELLIRMLIVGYCFGIRSERRLCAEVHLNLAYRWFCRVGLGTRQAARLRSIWPFSMMPHSGPQPRSHPSSLHRPIRRRGGPQRAADPPSLPIRTTM